MAIERITIYEGQKPTPEQIAEIEAAASRPVVFDDDCPELTPEQLDIVAAMARERRNHSDREIVSIPVSSAACKKIRTMTNNYTAVMGRLLEMALNNPQMVRQCL